MPPYIYVACQIEQAVTIIDIQDETNPVPIFVGSIQGAGAPNFLAGNQCANLSADGYIITAGLTDDAMSIINVANPAAPTLEGSIQGAGAPNFLGSIRYAFPLGNFVYCVGITDDRLVVIDISNPAIPTIAGSEAIAADPAGNIQVVGDLAYVARYGDGAANSGLWIYNISGPTAITLVGSLSGNGAIPWMGGAYFVFVCGDYAYVCTRWDNAFVIVDISTPATPTYVGHLRGAGAPNWLQEPYGCYIDGDYAYVTSRSDHAVTIINISNPAAPTLSGVIRGAGAPPGGNFLGDCRSCVKIGNFLYVTSDDDDSLTIINVTNPAAPTYHDSIRGAGAPPGGNYLNGARSVSRWVRSPTLTTNPATLVEGISATLNGTLDDDGGEACDCGFEYGETVDYSNTTPTQSRTTGQTFAQTISGLDPNKTYHFRAFAINAAGTSYGADRTFTTEVDMPNVTTDPASALSAIAATLNGTLDDDGGEACDCGFEWGLSTGYGTTTPTESKTLGESFSQVIAGLVSGTTYHFRAFATNTAGTSYGADRTFTTSLISSRGHALGREEL